jgi:catechol 2,3-dioxygenase-like lactoylglutathione lyase family enzyme
MSYVALVTSGFDQVTRFYGEQLGFSIVDEWGRSNARGIRFDSGGMRLKIIDNERKQHPCELGQTGDKICIVIEVENIDAVRDAPPIQDTSWGARLFQLRDPDGVPVTFLQWTSTESEDS